MRSIRAAIGDDAINLDLLTGAEKLKGEGNCDAR